MSDGTADAAAFRGRLAARILGLLGAASLVGQGAACWDGEVVLTGFGGGEAAGSGGSPAVSSASTGGASTGGASTGGASSTTTSSTTTSSTTSSSSSSAGGAPCGGWAPYLCFTPETMPCPQQSEWKTVIEDLTAAGCSMYDPCQVDSGPTVDAFGECCYYTHAVLCSSGGRPYLVEGGALVAPPLRGEGARGWVASEQPDLTGLGSEVRAFLAEAWAADGLLEHASVASFSRFALALLAVGAPAELVLGAHRAALDEVQHARLCFGLASAYAGEVISPGSFPLAGSLEVGASFAAIAVSTLEEGCVGETLAAVVASEQLARATDPAVRAVLAQIAADEARHAELAWKTVAWAVKAGGPEVRAAVDAALHGVLRGARTEIPAPSGKPGGAPERKAVMGALSMAEAHGRLDPATLATVVAGAMADVVAPAARALLRAGGARRAQDFAAA